MKINSRLLNIPPYISTTWDSVSGIFLDEKTNLFHITLHNGTKVSIPNLERVVIEQAFKAHAEYVEEQSEPRTAEILSKNVFPLGTLGKTPINLENLGAFTGMMQHDPSQSDAYDLPREILDRVSQVAKALGLDQGAFDTPEGEPHCNCPFCQIANVLHGTTKETETLVNNGEEEIPDTELKFREWDITQVADKLSRDNNHNFAVFSLDPIAKRGAVGWNATDVTYSLCPVRVATLVIPDDDTSAEKCHNFTVLS